MASTEELFNVHPDSIGNINNLSKWYSDMSLGEFQFTAQVYPYLVTSSSSSQSEEEIDNEVFRQIDSIQQYSIFDWSKFDKRKNSPNFLFDNTDTTNYPSDTILDFVIAVYRRPGSTGGDVGYPQTGSIFTDSIGIYNVSDGFRVQRFGDGNIETIKGLFIHEFGHAIYDAPHCGAGNGVTGTRFHTHSMWCMATTNQSRVFNTVNAWERWHLGWSEISYDLKDTTDNGVYTIDDYITSGDAIRVKIPHSNQHLWIENHQKVNSFDRHPWITNAYGDTIEYSDKGIYMYIEDLTPTQTRQFAYQSANKLKLLHANGHFDYSVSTNTTPAIEWWNAPAYNFNQLQENPFGDHHQASMLRFDYNNDGKIDYNPNYNNLSSGGPNEMYAMHRLGGNVVYGPAGEDMAFGVGDKVGLGNNPAIANIQYYNSNKGEVTPAHIHNVTVKVEAFDSINGTYQIKVLFNDAEVNNDVRWTGSLKLAQDTINTINNPQQIVLKSGNTITLDQSLTANRETQVVLHDETKSFALPTILVLESGTITTIEDSSELLVANGSTLQIKSGATLIVKGAGKVTIDDNSYICVEDSAIIELEDSTSQLYFSAGSNTGINPRLLQSGTISGNCIDFCEISNLITGDGTITGKAIADAGENQILCSTYSNNVLGGNPSAKFGVPPFTYSWIPTDNLDDATAANPVLTTSLTSDVTYTLEVTDSNGCKGTNQVTLSYSPFQAFTTSYTTTSCPGTSTATVYVPCGNADAYTYSWDDIDNQTTATAIGLFPGMYTVQVIDAAGDTTYKTVSIPFPRSQTYNYVNPVISDTVEWTSGLLIKVKGEVIIERGGVLTITDSDVEFSYDKITEIGMEYRRARITVQRGGILNVVNSTLSGCSGGTWDGIEVWGQADTSSRTTGLTGHQGYVNLNGATINNALRGVYANRLPLKNVFMYNHAGGKVTILASTFNNNQEAIVLRDYEYTSGNAIGGNTYFNYDLNKAPADYAFIKLENYNGLSVGNASFKNLGYADNIVGIKSENSTFACSGTKFYSLELGIDASAVSSLNTVNIASGKFYNCNRGAYLKGITGSEIIGNDFYSNRSFSFVPPTIVPADTVYGLYMLDCSLYGVEENDFFGTPEASFNSVGLYIYNTDTANNTQTNQIYRNTFKDLTFASFGNGENSSNIDPDKGLTFKCNTYQNNDYDIITTIAPGIAIEQGAAGSISSPAGNKFVDACGAITEGELYNYAVVGTQTNAYDYYHHNTATYIPDTLCYTNSQVVPIDGIFSFVTGPTGSCPYDAGCGGACRVSLKQKRTLNTTTIDELKLGLNQINSTQKVVGGANSNTTNTIAELTRENRLITNKLIRSYLHDVEDEYRFDSILSLTGNDPAYQTLKIEALRSARNNSTAMEELTELEKSGTAPEFCKLQRALMQLEAMPEKLMGIQNNSVLKDKITSIAQKTNEKGSIQARNLLSMVFDERVQETFHFPIAYNDLNRQVKNVSNEKLQKTSLEIEKSKSFNLYPNPNRGIFTLEYKLLENSKATVQILNLMGKMVYTQNLFDNTNKEYIRIADLPDGIYILNIKSVTGELLYNTKFGLIK